MDIFTEPFLKLILTVINLYIWALLISVILTWLVHFRVINTSNQFVYMAGEFLHRITEPALAPIRRVLPNLGGIDLSPMVLILGLIFLKDILAQLVYSIG
ncbi:MAG: YggT family protein [Rhodospirillales bacterium]